MKWFQRLWDIVWWGSIAVLAFLIVVFAWRAPAVREKEKTEQMVAQILAQRLEMKDVDGSNLPPTPDAALVDKTVEGIDANENGIRDDVELAIFEKYPDDVKIRAAELQYAMVLQNELNRVFSSGTFIAALQQEGRGYGCVFDTAPKVSLDDPQEKWTEQSRIAETRVSEVDNLVFDTSERKQMQEKNFQKYMRSYSSLNGEDCDLEI